MGEAIPLRAQSLQAQAGKVVEQIGTPALLIPSCGGLSADREEKRVTHGSDTAQPNRVQEQLDFRDPNQRGLLARLWPFCAAGDEAGVTAR